MILMTKTTGKIHGLSAWAEKLGKEELPILAGVVKELNELTGNEDADVNQLAEVILKDASLTSQVLRIANSVHYNHSSFPINTVSRAIVLIGFTGVRAICISLMVVDSLLDNEPRQRLLESMAKAFHAAVQAKNLIARIDDDRKEEVFIAALLYHIGDMCFWACGGEAAEELDEHLKKGNITVSDGAKAIIGTSLKAITRELANTWNLGETLVDVLDPPPNKKLGPEAIAVLIGEELSRNAMNGWDSDSIGRTIFKVSRFTGMDQNQAKNFVIENADNAAVVALTFGASRACHLIPTSNSPEKEASPKKPILTADPLVQLNILREMSNAATDNLDVNTVFQMALEGLHRGVGLERVVVAFIRGENIFARYVLGDGTEEWRDKFSFTASQNEENIFTHAVKIGEALWVDQNVRDKLKHLFSVEHIALLGKRDFFISVITLNDRPIAYFYADRADFGGKLDKVQFQSFEHFVTQTQTSLALLAKH
ncbi:hypothetical protein NBRC116492_19770 [Aurantivibrio infirmus]